MKIPTLKERRYEQYSKLGLKDNVWEAIHTDSKEAEKEHKIEDLTKYLPNYYAVCFLHIMHDHKDTTYYTSTWPALDKAIKDLAGYLSVPLPSIVSDGKHIWINGEKLKPKQVDDLKKLIQWGWIENQGYVRYICSIAKTIPTEDEQLLNLFDKLCEASAEYGSALYWQ